MVIINFKFKIYFGGTNTVYSNGHGNTIATCKMSIDYFGDDNTTYYDSDG
jgi:hypothetical protein